VLISTERIASNYVGEAPTVMLAERFCEDGLIETYRVETDAEGKISLMERLFRL